MVTSVNLFVQKMHLERLYPGSACTVRMDQLRWRGMLRPTGVSQVYTVKIEYKRSCTPRVSVVHPELIVREGETKLPHVYEGNSLCLYLPNAAEWASSMLLAKTIVPWASEWLLHYEVWFATGVWGGGGKHPIKGKA